MKQPARWDQRRAEAVLGHPRAALLGFTVAVLAFNVLTLLERCVEQAHQQHQPPSEVSTFQLACWSGAATRAC